jgi:hypothetical protein
VRRDLVRKVLRQLKQVGEVESFRPRAESAVAEKRYYL